MTKTAHQITKQFDSEAIEAVKSRFIRLPSGNSFPRIRDVVTNSEQADLDILCDYYSKHSTSPSPEPQYLLKCLDWVYGETFLPNGPRMSDGDLNLWQPPALKPSGNKVNRSQVSLFLEFLERWFPNDMERNYFGRWLAHAVRKPEERIIATPVLRSDHGVGKGFLVETLLSNLIGKQSVAVCGLRDVVGDFNDIVQGKTLLLIDEVYKSKKSTTDALKSFQGNSTILLKRKHKSTVTIDNYINFIVTSNSHVPLILEKGDRRFWVPEFIKHKESQAETSAFINDKLKPWLLDGGFQLVRDYLEGVNLDSFRATDAPPSTDSKKEMMGFSTEDRLEELLLPIIEEHPVLTLQWVKGKIAGNFERAVSDTTIASALFSSGCKQKKTNTQRLYITPKGLKEGYSETSSPKALKLALPEHF
ncbi:primase-helicase family protein [Vreelandella alkaliphila]|uniref:primase-helicase family protein n=1 Tax=Halomonadaceae TaxID=28256 RepID=UPI001868B2C0|nr:primase-helicase family protein [Halomonas colorata]